MNAQTVAPYFVTQRDKTLSALGEFIDIDELISLGKPPAFLGVQEANPWSRDDLGLPAFRPRRFQQRKSRLHLAPRHFQPGD